MEKVKVKIKKLNPDAIIPKYETLEAAGFDLAPYMDVFINPGQTVVVPTGLSVEIPSGYSMDVRPRSGTSLKTLLRVANSPGTIDADYRGEVGILITNNGAAYVHVKKGERIAQGVIIPVFQADFEETTELSETERGQGGFGSTGK